MRTMIAFAAALAFAGGALAQQYKWIDKDGRVRYGDVPPAGVNAKPLRSPAGPAAPAAKEPKASLSPAEQEAEFRKRRLEAQKEQEKQAKAAQADQAKQQHCANAKQQLATLESGQRISTLDPRSGERTFLDDSQRATETAKARKAVAEWCN